MENYEFFEEENSEWLKGLQSARDFSCDFAQHLPHSISQSSFMKQTPLDPSAGYQEDKPVPDKPPDLLDTYSFWEQHSNRNSPVTIKEPPKMQGYSRASSYETMSAPVMIESYLPTTHGVIKISFPSLSSIAAQSRPRASSHSDVFPASTIPEATSGPKANLPANDHIYEMIRSHLSHYYQLEERQRSHSEPPAFGSSHLASSSSDSHFISSNSSNFEPIITSATSSVTNLATSHTSSPDLNPFDSPTQRKEYFSLLYSDTSDDEDRDHLKVNSPMTEDGGMNPSKDATAKKGRGRNPNIPLPPTETNTDAEEEDDGSDDEADLEQESTASEESDVKEKKKKRKKRKLSTHPDSSVSMLPRRKASQFARDILMDWLVEHESNPYPTKRQKQELSTKTGLTLKQIVHWMSNVRKRRLIPLLSGRRMPTSNVDIKFLDEFHRKKQVKTEK